jgi:ATP-binding cassette subfamily B protein
LILQLLLGLFLSAGFEIGMPFLSREIIDTGIKAKEMDFIVLILLSQITILVAKSMIEFIRSWILLYISSRVNLTILISFVIKFLKLPLSFVEVRKPGDVLQRINDHGRIENFITSNTFTTVFSLFNLLALGILLSYFNLRIFLIFSISSVIYFSWITIFLKKRRLIDKSRFEVTSATQSKVVQLIDGFQEIKISNSDEVKRWEWEGLMAQEFRVRVKSLTLTQYQQTGSLIITEGRNLLITFIGAAMVIKGQLSIGTLFAVQFIVGQLIAPVESLIGFFQSMQDAKMSLERLQEIHEMEDEEPETAAAKQQIAALPGDIAIKHLSFRYPGTGSAFVLQQLNLIIPKGKVTAIVGLSGSGKTTLLKLLLKLHAPSKGSILAGDCNIEEISNRSWRNICGTVLQDGFIFSDTIARNIALGPGSIDKERMEQAIRCANIDEFINALPLGLETEIGNGAKGISQGQKQRILIARAVYKDPQILLFDEATNALDANNEKTIMNNLRQFFHNKTVVIVAHRLSTIKDADKIVVMEHGKIVEEGAHTDLLYNDGAYSRLIRNQTETLQAGLI